MLQATKRPGKAQISCEVRDGAIIRKSAYGLTRVYVVREDILRITFTRRDSFSERESEYVTERGRLKIAPKNAEIDPIGGSVRISDARGNAVVTIYGGWSMEAFTADRIVWGSKSQTETVQTADGAKNVIRAAETQPYKTLYRARLPLQFAEDETIYGFGQPEGGVIDRRHAKIYGCQTNRSIALPFFVSTKGYAMLFDCGCTFIYNGAAEKPYMYLEAVEELDLYVLRGSPEDAVRGYHLLTGLPALLPQWAFGYIQSQERYETGEELIEVVRECRKRNIGIDCIVEDWQSWPEGQWGQKSFDANRFPNPSGMMDELHAMNAHLMLSIWANPNGAAEDHRELAEKGLLLPDGEHYNPLLSEARNMYWKQAYEGLYRHGLDAWWCDSSEPWTSEWRRIEEPEAEDVYYETRNTASAQLGADYANAFAFFHARTMYEGQTALDDGKRVINLTRSGWIGQQKYGTILWSGDTVARWETLRNQITAGVNMCASGIPFWTQDIGGFFVKRGLPWYWDGAFDDGWESEEFCELYVRWFAFAAFLPVFRAHGTDVRRELWNAPGEYYDALLAINRLRYTLLRYVYSLAGNAALNGGTMIKPLGFNYPNDRAACAVNDQFLLGDDMLVCPVTEYGARSRKVYLPEGTWHDRRTGQTYVGKRTVEVSAPLDAIPVFLRAGAILPVCAPRLSAEETLRQAPHIEVFTGADGAFSMYEDAGDGYEYRNGEYTLTHLTWDDAKRKLRAENGAEYTIVLH